MQIQTTETPDPGFLFADSAFAKWAKLREWDDSKLKQN